MIRSPYVMSTDMVFGLASCSARVRQPLKPAPISAATGHTANAPDR